MKIIAKIKTEYPEKFGIPRQSGLVSGLPARIVFEKEYRQAEAVRGLEGFSHVWLLWQFSENKNSSWSATVRPPRLGGNKRVGVFATRSPYRPNAIGLSAVKLIGIDYDSADAPALIVDGADLLDGTPIVDIKPYLAYADSIPDAVDGFAAEHRNEALSVNFPKELLSKIPSEKQAPLLEILSQDPVPAYQNDPGRVYGLSFAGNNISFSIDSSALTVLAVEPLKKGEENNEK